MLALLRGIVVQVGLASWAPMKKLGSTPLRLPPLGAITLEHLACEKVISPALPLLRASSLQIPRRNLEHAA
jgi:hypothetical protein